MPLSYLNIGEKGIIRKVSGSKELRKRLNELGVTNGSVVEVMNKSFTNIILKVKDTLYGLDKDAVKNIQVDMVSYTLE